MARHSLCDVWELNRIILVWKDIAVSLKWLTKQDSGSYTAQYNSWFCLPASSFFFIFFFYMWTKAIWMCNKILWNQSNYVLVWHNVVKRGTGWAFSGPGMVKESFWQLGLAGCESLRRLQDSIGVFTWTLSKIFRIPRSYADPESFFVFVFSSMSDKLLFWLCEIMDTSGIYSLLRVSMNVNIHFIWTFTVCASSLFNRLNHKSKRKGASVNLSAAIRILMRFLISAADRK